MRTIIAGGRGINDAEAVIGAINLSRIDITEVLCGCANGVDKIGKQWALQHKIPVREFPADWLKYGKAAGPYRNQLMAENADALILVWDGHSKGSFSMLQFARREELLRKLVLAASDPGGLVVDPFSGSGTTVVVAEQLGRRWMGCDVDKTFNEWAIARVESVPNRSIDEWMESDRKNATRRESIR